MSQRPCASSRSAVEDHRELLFTCDVPDGRDVDGLRRYRAAPVLAGDASAYCLPAVIENTSGVAPLLRELGLLHLRAGPVRHQKVGVEADDQSNESNGCDEGEQVIHHVSMFLSVGLEQRSALGRPNTNPARAPELQLRYRALAGANLRHSARADPGRLRVDEGPRLGGCRWRRLGARTPRGGSTPASGRRPSCWLSVPPVREVGMSPELVPPTRPARHVASSAG